METRKIGSLEASVVGLGCNNFGGRIDEAKTAEVINAAIDEGINFFDTADIYGGTKSEEFMGRVLGKNRSKILIATKFGAKLDDDHFGAKPDYIKRACEDSLRRLQTDVIDLYQIHTPDDSVPIEDTLGALNELIVEGKVREIGCSNFSVAQLQKAEAKAPGAKFVSVQNEYSLLHREPEDGVLDECARQGLAFLPYFPLKSGLLSGKYRKGQPVPAGTRISNSERFAPLLADDSLDTVERYVSFAEARGHTILDLAFAWLLAEPTVASVIAGATSAEQVRANARAGSWVLSAGERAEL